MANNILNIGGKDYEIKFNLGFARYLDKKYPIEQATIKGLAAGVHGLAAQLRAQSYRAIVDAIHAGTATEKVKPSEADIDTFIDELEDLDPIFEMIDNGLKNSPLMKKPYLSLLEEARKAEKKAK